MIFCESINNKNKTFETTNRSEPSFGPSSGVNAPKSQFTININTEHWSVSPVFVRGLKSPSISCALVIPSPAANANWWNTYTYRFTKLSRNCHRCFYIVDSFDSCDVARRRRRQSPQWWCTTQQQHRLQSKKQCTNISLSFSKQIKILKFNRKIPECKSTFLDHHLALPKILKKKNKRENWKKKKWIVLFLSFFLFYWSSFSRSLQK